MTREEEKKPNPLAIGSTNQDADSDQLKAQVMSNRQALLSQLSANQPGVRPEDESEFESEPEPTPAPESVVPTPTPSPPPAPAPIDSPPPAPVAESTMGRVVEVIFDTLQSNCVDANRALAGSEAQLNCQRPAGIQMRTSPQTGASVQAMRGNVSLPNYSLVVDCTDERILVFIIPSEFLLGFDPESELFTPHLVLRQLHREGQSAWFMDNTPVGNVMLPEIARQLLRNLIAVARGEANPKQPFAFGKPAPIAGPAPAAVAPPKTAAPVPPGMAGAQAQAPAPAPIAAPAPAPVAAGASSYSQSLSRSQTVKQLMVGALDEPRREPMPFYVAPAPEAPSPEPPSNGGATSAPAPAPGPMPPQTQALPQAQAAPQAAPAERRRADIRETNEFAMLSELISKDKSAPSPQISPVRSASQSDEMWQRPESAAPPAAPIPPGRARPSSPAPMPAPAPAPVSPPPPAPAESGSGNFRVPSDLFESQDSVPQIEPAVSAQNAFPVPPGHMVPPESLPVTAPAPEPAPEPPPAPLDAPSSEVSGVQAIPEIPFSMPIPTPAPVPASEPETAESAPESAAMSGPSEAAAPSIQPVEPSLSRMDAPLEEKSEGLLSKVIAESAGEAEEAPAPSFKSLKSLISAGDEEESAPPKAELPPPVGIEAPSSSLQALLSDSEEDEALPPPPAPPQSVEESPAAPVSSVPKAASAEAAGDLGKLVTDTEKQLFEGCDQLMNNLERALATLKSAGVEAMQDDNIEQVTEIMNHTKRLKTLRDRLAALKVEID